MNGEQDFRCDGVHTLDLVWIIPHDAVDGLCILASVERQEHKVMICDVFALSLTIPNGRGGESHNYRYNSRQP